MNTKTNQSLRAFVFGISSVGLLAWIYPVEMQSQETRPPQANDRGKASSGNGGRSKISKPRISDTVRANVYADNWFKLYLNGDLVAVDSISFILHNVVSVDILPEYPMTIAVMAKDNADPDTGLEYENTKIGDGGFILKFGDGTVTNATWKAKSFFRGPLNGDLENPSTFHDAIPPDGFEVDFDDHVWAHAVDHEEAAVGPKAPFYENDFAGARWIWTEGLALDNTVLFRPTIVSSPDGRPLPGAWPRGKIDESNRAESKRASGEK